MPYKIEWTVDAEEDLGLLLDYLSKNWNAEITLKYIEKLEKNIQRIIISPNLHSLIN